MNPFRKCNDSRRCFAQQYGSTRQDGTVIYKCTLLNETYADGECPFCKPNRFVYKGKRYDGFIGQEENDE